MTIFFVLSFIASVIGVAIVANRWLRAQEPTGFDIAVFACCVFWAVGFHILGQVTG